MFNKAYRNEFAADVRDAGKLSQADVDDFLSKLKMDRALRVISHSDMFNLHVFVMERFYGQPMPQPHMRRFA